MSVSCLFVFIGKYFVICNNIKWMKLIKLKLVQNEGSIKISVWGWIKSLFQWFGKASSIQIQSKPSDGI